MRKEEERVEGYSCDNDNPFWIDANWASPPERFPVCYSRNIRATWYGRVKKYSNLYVK